jgi:hypothetical protein
MSYENAVSYQSNQYSAQSACQHCEGIVDHEHWCLTLNPVVRYACEVVIYPDKLTIGDRIILHSLGVRWGISPAERNGLAKREETVSLI